MESEIDHVQQRQEPDLGSDLLVIVSQKQRKLANIFKSVRTVWCLKSGNCQQFGKVPIFGDLFKGFGSKTKCFYGNRARLTVTVHFKRTNEDPNTSPCLLFQPNDSSNN